MKRISIDLIMVVILVIAMAALIHYQHNASMACSSAGGVYLPREMKCVTCIKEINP